MAAPAVVGVAGNSRVGTGTVSVTPPASSTAYLAVVLDNGDTPNVTPATGFALVGSMGAFTFLYRCPAGTSPGSSWTIAGTGGDTGGIVVVIGYDRGINAATPVSASGLSSPTVTATETCLVLREFVGARSNDVAPGYPASTTGQGYDNQAMTGYALFLAVAHSSVSAGSAGAATWAAGASGSILGSDAASVLVTEVLATITGTSAQSAILPTSAASGTVSGPAGTSTQVTPLPTQAASGSFTPPARTGTSAAAAILPTQSAAGTVGLAAPTGLAASGVDHGLSISFNAVSSADGYVVEWRRTDLSPPSTQTQSGAPGHLDRLDDATGTDGTYQWTYDGAGVIAYDLDSGVRYSHQEFTGRTRPGFSLGATPYGTDSEGHGTATASTILGTTYGVAKGATICSVNVGDPTEWDTNNMTAAQMEDCFDFILGDRGSSPAVVNMSFGVEGMNIPAPGGGADSTPLQTQLTRMLDAGIPLCIALGNDNRNNSADLLEGDDRIIWVGNSTVGDARASTSNYATMLTVYAPADAMTCATNTSNSAVTGFGGTSGATPMVAGVVAKILQANPQLSVARVKEVLVSQARPVITGVPAGPNLLLNSDAQTSDWSRHLAASNTLTLDGLDNTHAYEIRVRTVKSGQESPPTTSVAATTGTITGTSAATTPLVTSTATGLFAPARTGTSAQTAPLVTVASSGTVTMPSVAGASTQVTPSPALSGSGTVVPPAVTGTSGAVAPLVTQASSGAASSPPGTAALTTPLPTHAAIGTATPPQFSGTSVTTVPLVTVAASGTAIPPGITGTGALTAPMPTSAGSGSSAPPGTITGTAAVTAPTPTSGGSGTFTPLTVSGASSGQAPRPLHAATGTVTVTITNRRDITVTGTVGSPTWAGGVGSATWFGESGDPMQLSTISKEYVTARLTSRAGNGSAAVILDSQPVYLGLVPAGQAPQLNQFYPAEWVGAASTQRWCRMLVGPNGGVTTYTAGVYDLYARIDDTSETPVRKMLGQVTFQ